MSEGNQNNGSRRIIPRRSQLARPVLAPSVQDLLDDALSVVSYEIIRLKQKVMKDPIKGLDLRESKILQGYVKSLVDLSREERERASEADFANMSDDELLQLVENLKQKRALSAAASEPDNE